MKVGVVIVNCIGLVIHSITFENIEWLDKNKQHFNNSNKRIVYKHLIATFIL